MNIFIENWIPFSALLLVSIGSWLVGYVVSTKRKKGNSPAVKLLLSSVSLLANTVLSILILVWGGGLEHLTAVFMLSLFLTLN